MYWYGTSEKDRQLADEWFLSNTYTLIDDGKQWRWLVWLRKMSADKYYLVVSKFGAIEFNRKQRMKERRNGKENQKT